MRALFISLLLAFAVCVQADICTDNYLNGKAPEVTVSQEICYPEYTIGFSYDKLIPLFAAEHLTVDEVRGANNISRRNSFHAEMLLLPQHRVLPKDYINSGFDRGHLAPAGDFATYVTQYTSFTMANITPQTKDLNERVWGDLENDVRKSVLVNGDAWIVTGSLFVYSKVERLAAGIAIPHEFYKAVYFPKVKQLEIYVGVNSESSNLRQTTRAAFRERYGFDPFPGL